MNTKNYRNHVIVCGFNALSEIVIDKLLLDKKEVVVIEKDPIKIEELKYKEVIFYANNHSVISKAEIDGWHKSEEQYHIMYSQSMVPRMGIFPYGNGTVFARCSLRSAPHAQTFRFPHAKRAGALLP